MCRWLLHRRHGSCYAVLSVQFGVRCFRQVSYATESRLRRSPGLSMQAPTTLHSFRWLQVSDHSHMRRRLAIWSVPGRSRCRCAAGLWSCELARLCSAFAHTVRTRLRSITFDFPLLTKITCCDDSVYSAALLWRLCVTFWSHS